MDEVEIRDEDLLAPIEAEVEAEVEAEAEAESMDIEPVVDQSEAKSEPQVVEPIVEPVAGTINKRMLHLKGVDSMSTEAVKLYVDTGFPGHEFKINWIEDSSVNVEFADEPDAAEAFKALTLNGDVPPLLTGDPSAEDRFTYTTLRPAKEIESSGQVEGLQIRFATSEDKKTKGSRARSRYYLLHGEPSFEDERHRFNVPKIPEAQVVDESEDLFPELVRKYKQDHREPGEPLRAKAKSEGRSLADRLILPGRRGYNDRRRRDSDSDNDRWAKGDLIERTNGQDNRIHKRGRGSRRERADRYRPGQ